MIEQIKGGISGIDREEEDIEIIWRYEENCYVIDYNRYVAREKDVIGEIVQMMKSSLIDDGYYTGK